MNAPDLHQNYRAVQQAAEWSHAHNRSLEGISDEMTLLARLYAYGFRGQIIGTFHATSKALEELEASSESESVQLAIGELRALGALSVEVIPEDYRAVLGIFHRYHTSLSKVLAWLGKEAEADPSSPVHPIRRNLIEALERITNSSGLVITRDDEIPPQASFVVPSLGITILPLVYGDQHSWNMAFLAGDALDVPRHLHRRGVEIHLGFGALQGDTCLGKSMTEVHEGYAMPIPSHTPHGYLNRSRQEHKLPFIFGSRRLGGWGIIPDVERAPTGSSELTPVSFDSKEMNGIVALDQEIALMAMATGNDRRTLIGPERTFSPTSGGLVLFLVRIERSETLPESHRYRIMAVTSGRGRVTIGSAQADLFPHAHFGIPTGCRANITAQPHEPLILLEAFLVEKLT